MKSTKMNISVIIPMYNSSYTIVSCLNSIKEQTAIDEILEVIVVNDGSNDNSETIVNDYKEKNKSLPIILLNKENGGVSSARNYGIQHSQGEWLALLDSDDCWLPNKIKIQKDLICNNNSIDFLGGAIDDSHLKILFKKVNTLYKASIFDLCIKTFPQTSTVIFKKSIYDQIGGYDESQNYAEDGNYFMKICSSGYNYFFHPSKVIEFGNGKPTFGHSGLSANLKEMHNGNIKNITELYEQDKIGKNFYVTIKIFENIKYLRRYILTKLR